MQQAESISIGPLFVLRLASRTGFGRHSRLLLLLLSLPVLLGMGTTISAQQPSIVVSPPRINPNEALDIQVTSVHGGPDLSNVTSAQVAIQPGDEISEIDVLSSSKTVIIFSLSVGNAQLGSRTLVVFGPDLRTVLGSAPLTVVTQGLDCPDSQSCCRNDPKTGLCLQCQTATCPVTHVCPHGQDCCDDDGGASGHCNHCARLCQ